SNPSNLTPTENGTVIFLANDGLHGFELWKSKGSAAETMLVRDINPGPADSMQFNDALPVIYQVNHATLFTASDGIHGMELWSTDGLPQHTAMLQDIAPGPGSSAPFSFVEVGTKIFFSANDNSTGRELWIMPAFAGNLPPQAADAVSQHNG